jgi:hypothetical protein
MIRPTEAQTVILTGQSNAGTGANHADPLPDPADQGWHILARDASGDPVSLRTTGYGPEVGMFQAQRPTLLTRMAHYAVGGQPITDWMSGGTDYSQACADIITAMNWQPPSVLVFVQGEADAQVEALADAYQANLTGLVNQWRNRWNANLPIVIVLLSSDSGHAFAATVRAAQIAVAAADPLIATVDSTGIPKHDVSHYTGPGQIILGHAVAAAAGLV